MQKTTFGVIVGTRGIFNPEQARDGRKDLLKKLTDLGFEYVILPESATPYGAVETVEDAMKYAELFRKERKRIDGVVVSLPNFGDELGVVNTLAEADLKVPVMVHAADDDMSKLGYGDRRDSFCGKLSVCCNLYQYGIKVTNTQRHTSSVDGEELSEDLKHFAAVCRVVSGLKGARIGQIGTRPAAFQTVRYSEKLLQDSGITVVPVDLSEILAMANSFSDSGRIKDRIAAMKAYGRATDEARQEMFERVARLGLVMDDWMEANGCVAGAIQCWESVQKNYGCATCLPMSMMGNRGMPMACETDVTGAVTMYALYLAAQNAPGYLDWNNNYHDDPEKCICTHCSNFPKDFLGVEPELSPLDILGGSLGRERCFAAIKGNVKGGPMTYAKISTDDSLGIVKAYVGDGQFLDHDLVSPGGIAVCEVPGLQELLGYMCQNGFEHHVAMVRGNVADAIAEAFGNYLDWDVYQQY